VKKSKKFSKPDHSRVINGDIELAEAPNKPENDKKRLDIAISEQYEAINRSRAQKMIKSGKVYVNGVAEAKAGLLVGSDDKVRVELPKIHDIAPQELPVIYEDDDVIVINKPAGTLSHTKGDSCDEFTVADFIESKIANFYHKKGKRAVGDGGFADAPHDDNARRGASKAHYTNVEKPLVLSHKRSANSRTGIVHRLDRDTSGVMIGAKNEQARTKLQAQFSQRKAKKTYYAVVEGHLKNDQAIIDLPIRRNAKRPTTFLVEAGGREAITSYRVIEMNNRYSLVELKPQTGRTHQLRVHLAHLGHPIVGDRVYGHEADRLYLHAAELELTLPNGERETFKSPLPLRFKELVK
jgi:23S rRNA pseudouridine1911/1915/1917 synthase